jgi:aspartate kinase
MKMDRVFQEGQRLCHGVTLLKELTTRARDSISSVGERLSAPLLAAALEERGVASYSIEACEILVTDSNYGAADPCMDRTRELCEARLRPMLLQGIVPVVTGFIGATADGVITTLGRGGSDYSATILGSALQADEVVIWTDVDGLMSTDPRAVPNAATIAEISYREATELAYFGAKVLHPKSLRGVAQCGIPVSIRNTFAPERPGTKITTSGPPNGAGVKAVAVINDIALITVAGAGMFGAPDLLLRTLATITAIRADVLVILQSSSQSDVCVVVSSTTAKSIVEALRFEFAAQAHHCHAGHIAVDSTVSLVTVVGQNMRALPGVVGRTFRALDKENVNIVAIAQGSSECNISLVVSQKDAKAAVAAIHEEFQLGHTELASPALNLAAAAPVTTT